MNSSRWWWWWWGGGGGSGEVGIFILTSHTNLGRGLYPPPRSATGLNGLLLISAPVLVDRESHRLFVSNNRRIMSCVNNNY